MPRLSPLLLDGRVLLDADRIVQAGLADRRASFELSLGALPPHAGFAVVAGVETLLARLALPLVQPNDLEAVKRVAGVGDALLERLARFALRVDIDVVPDGTIAFAGTPLAAIEGPFVEAALLGGLIRGAISRGTMVATRATRLHIAAGGDPLIDGSSVHAASPSASLALARAAHVGGASATTNLLAAALLGISFRESASLDVGVIAAPSAAADGWGESHADLLVDLGHGDDEELVLLEAKRIGTRAGGWIARGLCDADPSALGMRYDLVALEDDGAWSPRRGARGDALPGRKRVARYLDAAGRPMVDIVHLQNERIQTPRSLGAATLTSPTRTVMRGGHMIEAVEPAQGGRERAIVGRAALESAVLQLRRPAAYRVGLSTGVTALRDTLDLKSKPPLRVG